MEGDVHDPQSCLAGVTSYIHLDGTHLRELGKPGIRIQCEEDCAVSCQQSMHLVLIGGTG